MKHEQLSNTTAQDKHKSFLLWPRLNTRHSLSDAWWIHDTPSLMHGEYKTPPIWCMVNTRHPLSDAWWIQDTPSLMHDEYMTPPLWCMVNTWHPLPDAWWIQDTPSLMHGEYKTPPLWCMVNRRASFSDTNRFSLSDAWWIEELPYWAIQQSWFARVNALCNLSHKKSWEVAAHFWANFWVGVASRCA